MYTVEYFVDEDGNAIVDAWRRQLTDRQASARIATRIGRLKHGAFGDCKPLKEGVWELRIDCGPGYRLYYTSSARRSSCCCAAAISANKRPILNAR